MLSLHFLLLNYKCGPCPPESPKGRQRPPPHNIEDKLLSNATKVLLGHFGQQELWRNEFIGRFFRSNDQDCEVLARSYRSLNKDQHT
ncbi:hypothetical protein AVEN_201232-1 [Araneus ventricosus]|uniref:Uncharacterized protein n=1 Tax=Araneus ventricosus TaxID=182803 RepID=A0A4Y2HJE6_ARAVE|nr:hypothetical protein AVEN_201232-1 [Araneus ventricosus]